MPPEEPIPFIDYWNAVDKAMLKIFAIDTIDAGIGPNLITAAKEEGQIPEDFALCFGEKYGLNLHSESKTKWGGQS